MYYVLDITRLTYGFRPYSVYKILENGEEPAELTHFVVYPPKEFHDIPDISPLSEGNPIFQISASVT
jgi:hypothetical protein